jgi:hypothetical protein
LRPLRSRRYSKGGQIDYVIPKRIVLEEDIADSSEGLYNGDAAATPPPQEETGGGEGEERGEGEEGWGEGGGLGGWGGQEVWSGRSRERRPRTISSTCSALSLLLSENKFGVF